MDGSNPKRSVPHGLAGAAAASALAHESHRLAPVEELAPRDFAGEVVEKLLHSYRTASGAMQHVNSYELPSMEEVARIIKLCQTLLFPGFVGGLLRATETELREFVRERVDEL